MDIGNRLKEMRAERGETQKKVAAALGVSVTCYAGYEQGYRLPDLDILAKMADFFDVSTDYLLGREDDLEQVAELSLSEMERDLLSKFKKLPEIRQQTVIDSISDMLDSEKFRNLKNKSIS